MKTLKMLTIMALIFFTSCGKDGPGGIPKTTVSGYVYEKDTQKPLEDIPVKLVDMGGGALGLAAGGSANSSEAVFITGSDGYYHFEFEGDGSYGIFTVGRWPDYYHLPGYKPVNKGEHNEINFTLQPPGWLEIRVKNINPFDYGDMIGFDPGGGGNTTFLFGTQVDETFIFKNLGNGNVRVTWYVEKNEEKETFEDNFYLKGHDTTYYEILY